MDLADEVPSRLGLIGLGLESLKLGVKGIQAVLAELRLAEGHEGHGDFGHDGLGDGDEADGAWVPVRFGTGQSDALSDCAEVRG